MQGRIGAFIFLSWDMIRNDLLKFSQKRRGMTQASTPLRSATTAAQPPHPSTSRSSVSPFSSSTTKFFFSFLFVLMFNIKFSFIVVVQNNTKLVKTFCFLLFSFYFQFPFSFFFLYQFSAHHRRHYLGHISGFEPKLYFNFHQFKVIQLSRCQLTCYWLILNSPSPLLPSPSQVHLVLQQVLWACLTSRRTRATWTGSPPRRMEVAASQATWWRDKRSASPTGSLSPLTARSVP